MYDNRLGLLGLHLGPSVQALAFMASPCPAASQVFDAHRPWPLMARACVQQRHGLPQGRVKPGCSLASPTDAS